LRKKGRKDVKKDANNPIGEVLAPEKKTTTTERRKIYPRTKTDEGAEGKNTQKTSPHQLVREKSFRSESLDVLEKAVGRKLESQIVERTLLLVGQFGS